MEFELVTFVYSISQFSTEPCRRHIVHFYIEFMIRQINIFVSIEEISKLSLGVAKKKKEFEF